MNTRQISTWLSKNKKRFPVISIDSGVSVPTLYSLAYDPEKKRQQRIIDAVSKYIDSQKVVK